MAYSRYYRARSRAVRRRNRKILSTRNIFGRVKARSQASQIYALKKRVNRISRVCAPELNTIQSAPAEYTLSSSSLGSSYQSFNITYPALGTGPHDRSGNTIDIRKIEGCMTFEYYNTSSTGYHDSESSGTPVRVIAIQSKDPQGQFWAPALGDLLIYSNYLGNEYTQRAVSPFIDGISTSIKILYDKVFYLTPTKNQKVLRVPLNIGYTEFDKVGNCPRVLFYIIPCGLHTDSNFTEYVEGTFSAKMVFTP